MNNISKKLISIIFILLVATPLYVYPDQCSEAYSSSLGPYAQTACQKGIASCVAEKSKSVSLSDAFRECSVNSQKDSKGSSANSTQKIICGKTGPNDKFTDQAGKAFSLRGIPFKQPFDLPANAHICVLGEFKGEKLSLIISYQQLNTAFFCSDAIHESKVQTPPAPEAGTPVSN